MHLKKFTVTGYRSYLFTQAVRLEPTLTVLAGRNNVGKTALLRALRIPADAYPETRDGIADSFHVEYTWSLTHAEMRAGLGEVGDLVQAVGDPNSEATCELTAAFVNGLDAVRLPELTAEPGFQIVSPNMTGLVLTESSVVGTPIGLRAFRYGNQIALWWDRVRFASTSPDSPDRVVRLLQQYVNFLGSQVASSYYISPRRVSPPMAYSVTPELAPDGSNLTAVVATILNNDRHGAFQQVEDFMRSAFPDISSIEVKMAGPTNTLPLGTIQLVYKRASSQLTVSLAHCGTGIEQMLMLATAILTAPGPRLFLIDEPHAFLHPSAERHLLRLIQTHPQHQYVVATHSPVFLNSVGLKHTRLITLDGEGSHINDETTLAEIIDAVGITAADLWSADAILWIEGPSDRETFEKLVACAEALKDITCRVVAMPDGMRSVSASPRNADAAVRFCESVRKAILPVRVQSLFLWDGDEKSEELRQQIMTATGKRARFLPVRELENLFLVPAAVQAVLARRCEAVDREVPTVDQVAADIQDCVRNTSNRLLYKQTPSGPDEDKVVGSEVLAILWRKWALIEYDKVKEGPQLLDEVLAHEPARLEPLYAVLRELAEPVESEDGPT